jgi:hypothetical protein
VSRNVPLLNLRAEKEFGYSKATTPSRLDSLARCWRAPARHSVHRHHAHRSAKLIPKLCPKEYPGASHAIIST